MKNKINIVLIIIITLLIASCNSFYRVDKKHYRKGYYYVKNNKHHSESIAENINTIPQIDSCRKSNDSDSILSIGVENTLNENIKDTNNISGKSKFIAFNNNGNVIKAESNIVKTKKLLSNLNSFSYNKSLNKNIDKENKIFSSSNFQGSNIAAVIFLVLGLAIGITGFFIMMLGIPILGLISMLLGLIMIIIALVLYLK